MKTLKENNTAVSTLIAFTLIPLSGFATDIYLPSFPAMTHLLGTNQASIQLTLVAFVVSSGIGQLFVGSLVDRYGRYRLSLASLFVFALASFAIAFSNSIALILTMRIVQGLTVALIVVSKRAFIMDTYSGEKLKHYTSLFSIIWAIAPIVAPFIGGFLQQYFGWRSNFVFLGSATLILLALDMVFGGETIKQFHPLTYKSLVSAYSSKLSTKDFVATLVILGLAYSVVIMFNMASPFIVEQVFHQSAMTTGNFSLASGVAILIGGLLSKSTLHQSIHKKMTVAGSVLISLSIVLIGGMSYFPSLTTMMMIIFGIHVFTGFTFNTFYAYALNRFSTHAGIVSGLTGSGTYIITSLISYSVTSVLDIKDPVALSIGYFMISTLIVGAFFLFALLKRTETGYTTESKLKTLTQT